MASLTWKNAGRSALSGREISIVALMISFPVMGLDQFLRTASGRFSAQPFGQVEHWVTDSLIMLPLFAVGVWAADRIAGLARLGGVGTARRADVLKRAVLVALLAALAQVPAWFVVNKSDNPATTQPLVAPQAHNGGDVYWVAPWVVIALVCVCLAAAAVWIAQVIGRGITTSRGAAAFTFVALLVPLLAVAALFAWGLHQAAYRAYASQVYYTSAPAAITRHSHVFSAVSGDGRLESSPVTAAPFAFAYQAAHALQDGLAGQAAGLPVAVIALLWVARGVGGTNQYHPANTDADTDADTKGGVI